MSAKLKAIFYKCLPFFLAVFAFFSYSYYNKRKEAGERVDDINARNDANKDQVKQNVKQLDTAVKDTAIKKETAEKIVLEPVKPHNNLQDAVDDFNRG